MVCPTRGSPVWGSGRSAVRVSARPAAAVWGEGAPLAAGVGFGAQPRLRMIRIPLPTPRQQIGLVLLLTAVVVVALLG